MAGLVIVGHGSHLNPASDVPVFVHAQTIRHYGGFDEVREAFWKEEPSLREVLRTVESDQIYVVPLLMSEGYFTRRVIPRELRLGDDVNRPVDRTVRYADPVGTAPTLADVIIDRAKTVTQDPDVGPGVGLALVGHGTERHPDSSTATRTHADRIRQRNRFTMVRALFLDEDPKVTTISDQFDCTDVVVVPVFVADGYHTNEDIPRLLGLNGRPGTGYENPSTVDGHRLWYSGAVGTEPRVAQVIVDRAIAAGATVDRLNTTDVTALHSDRANQNEGDHR